MPVPPPPPQTEPELIESLPFPTAGIPGVPDLMHHKYIVRDRHGGLDRLDELDGRLMDARGERDPHGGVAPSSRRASASISSSSGPRRDVGHSGKVDTAPFQVGGTSVRAWFCPGRGERLAHRIAKAIGTAQRRVRIASPVLSSAPILATLAQVVARRQGRRRRGRRPHAGARGDPPVAARTGTRRGRSRSCGRCWAAHPFSGKHSTPYSPDSVHDFMHAKVTVADDIVFVGSFNLSHSGERNAENVLEIADAAMADELAAFIDTVRARYPRVEL